MSSGGSRDASARTASASLTSAPAKSAFPPAALIASTAPEPPGWSRSTTQTAAPCRAKQRAIASPMPDPAPVTRAVLPSSLNMGPAGSGGGWAGALGPAGGGIGGGGKEGGVGR